MPPPLVVILRHPLSALLARAPDPYSDAAQTLRDVVIDAIESLEPPTGAPSYERDRRPYLVLMHRYVDGFTTEDIVERLHISPRQFQRELQKGLQALSAYLWNRLRDAGPGTDGEDPAGTSGLQAEVRTLGVELESLALAEVLAEARLPAEALARRHGVALSISSPGGNVRCLCDRVLAKQTVISCLSLLMSKHPQFLELAPGLDRRLPKLDLRLLPPLRADGFLADELETCRTLMSAQQGSVRVIRGEDGLIHGVRLHFRPEGGSHVLVIDDNRKMLQLYERYLARGRFTVSTATSTSEAEEALQRSQPDAIVLDVMMREADGWELLQRLRSQPSLSRVPVLVCSVLNEPDLAYALGAQAYLKKPVSAEDLLAALGELLER